MDLDKWERDRERFLQWCLKKPEEERELIVEMTKKPLEELAREFADSMGAGHHIDDFQHTRNIATVKTMVDPENVELHNAELLRELKKLEDGDKP